MIIYDTDADADETQVEMPVQTPVKMLMHMLVEMLEDASWTISSAGALLREGRIYVSEAVRNQVTHLHHDAPESSHLDTARISSELMITTSTGHAWSRWCVDTYY